MDIRQLRVLQTVLRTGSISEAARILNISQPAVSKTIGAIESAVDLPLFERINGRLVPTMQAHALVPDIKRVLDDFALVRQAARELRDGKRGHLKIAAPPTLTASIIPLAIASFSKSNPAVEFTITATATRDVVELVARHEVDLGICQPSSGDVYVQSFDVCRGAVICLMPAEHELSRFKRVRPLDLVGHELISFPLSEPTGARIAEAFRSEGLRFRISIEVNQSFAACALVKAGIGIALVDSFLPMRTAFPGVDFRPFSPTIHLNIQLMSSTQRMLSPLVRAFRDELVTAAKRWSTGS